MWKGQFAFMTKPQTLGFWRRHVVEEKELIMARVRDLMAIYQNSYLFKHKQGKESKALVRHGDLFHVYHDIDMPIIQHLVG